MAFASSKIGAQEAIIKPCDLCEDDEDVNWFCKDCFQNLCDRCKKMHLKICRSHEVVSILEGIAITKEAVTNLCQDHNVPFSFFCRTCDENICSWCLSTKHKKHDFIDIHEYQSELHRMLDSVINEKEVEEGEMSKKLVTWSEFENMCRKTLTTNHTVINEQVKAIQLAAIEEGEKLKKSINSQVDGQIAEAIENKEKVEAKRGFFHQEIQTIKRNIPLQTTSTLNQFVKTSVSRLQSLKPLSLPTPRNSMLTIGSINKDHIRDMIGRDGDQRDPSGSSKDKAKKRGISQGKSHEKQDHEDEKDYSSRNKTVLEKKLAGAKEEFQTHNLMIARHSRNRDEVVFIGFDEKCPISEEVRAEFAGIKVYLRHPYYVDDEARRIAEFKERNNGEISESHEKLITSWILANSDRVWESHSNLRVLSSDCLKSTSTEIITNKPCIVLYCRWKGFIPLDEDAFPSFVEYEKERIDVDVREGYFYFSPRDIIAGSPNQYNDPLCMGSCIGEKNKDKAGSIGLFVQWNRNSTGRKVNGFITCSHVLFECTQLADLHYFPTEHDIKYVVQPAEGFSPHETRNSLCGKVAVAHFHTNTPKSVDVAVVEVSDRMPTTSGFVITRQVQINDAGFDRKTFPEYADGRIITEIPSNERRQPVVKFGTATGLTGGQLRLAATEVFIEKDGALLGDSASSGKRIMKGQYEVYKTTPTPFSIPGDSGAAVFLYDTQDNLNCIGMVIGNISHGSTVVTPIGNILECLGFDESNIVRFPPTTDEED